MRVERKDARHSRARRWHQGPLGPLQFDGYNVVAHFKAESGEDVRVIFERHEAEALRAFIARELGAQTERVASQVKALRQVHAERSEPVPSDE